MSGVLRPVRSYSLERRLSLWTPSVEPSRPRPRGVPPAPLGASPSSVPVFFVLLPAVSRCSSLSLLLLPVVFIPSRRNERLPRRDARGPCPGRDAIPGQRFGAAPSFAVIAERHGGQSATPTRGPAHFARVRRMRLRSTTTTTGATTWRVGPSGMAPLPGWRRVLFRRDRRSVRRGPADGLRPASWSGTGPWPARVGGTGALRRNGDLFANSVRTCGPAGCWGSSPGRLYLFLSPTAPLPVVRALSRADSGRRAGTEGPRAGVLLCRPARRRAAARVPTTFVLSVHCGVRQSHRRAVGGDAARARHRRERRCLPPLGADVPIRKQCRAAVRRLRGQVPWRQVDQQADAGDQQHDRPRHRLPDGPDGAPNRLPSDLGDGRDRRHLHVEPGRSASFHRPCAGRRQGC